MHTRCEPLGVELRPLAHHTDASELSVEIAAVILQYPNTEGLVYDGLERMLDAARHYNVSGERNLGYSRMSKWHLGSNQGVSGNWDCLLPTPLSKKSSIPPENSLFPYPLPFLPLSPPHRKDQCSFILTIRSNFFLKFISGFYFILSDVKLFFQSIFIM